MSPKKRNLVIVLGDQLNSDSAAFDDFDTDDDVVWMAEVAEEATHVWSHKARIAIFLSAMRHFRDALREKDFEVDYRLLDDDKNAGDLAGELASAAKRHAPDKLIVVQPGEHRVQQLLQGAAAELDLDFEVREDRHFLCTPEEFAEHAEGRKQLRMEYFYREMRRRYDVLMDGDEPEGGDWNYDEKNRASFSKDGPDDLAHIPKFGPDDLTQEVLDIVMERFASHPGDLAEFHWPVTRRNAIPALREFIADRLPRFGKYQDAMWTNEPFLHHSLLSTALNLKLLNPREVIEKAEAAYHDGDVPLPAAEGFIRQILGWREYVRGVYWLHGPEYLERNALDASESLPAFYWSGEVEMNCLSQAIRQTLRHGYAHHIQRLMVTGLYALLFGVDPAEVHRWYLAVYVDAVEWVEAPNTIGMSQYADGGVMASKPYIASGKYIKRMSNYCNGCRFNPDAAVGQDACPFTTMYWDFLARHHNNLECNNRMRMQLKNLERKSKDEIKDIRNQAKEHRAKHR